MRYWTPILDGMHRGTGPDTWDYQWMFANLMRGAVSVVPRENLVRNLGFGAGATHSIDPQSEPAVSVGTMSFPLRHPAAVEASKELDALDQQLSEWHKAALPWRAVRKARRVLFG